MHHWRTQWVPQEREANYPDCSGSCEGGEPLPCDIDIGRGLSPTEAITTQNKSDLLLMGRAVITIIAFTRTRGIKPRSGVLVPMPPRSLGKAVF